MLQQGLTITDDSRCHYMMNPGGIVWESMNALATAFRQNEQQHIHFIQYDDIVSDPEKVMQGIHWYLKLKPYKYDFNNINLKNKFEKIKKIRSKRLPTVPSSLEEELKSNIFLRCNQNDLKVKLNMGNQEDFKVFKKIRDLKDSF